jgi:signal transduction histidine kinase
VSHDAAPAGAPGRLRTVWARLRSDAGTIRVRTTAAAMLVVGLALTGAAVGLVMLLHNRLEEDAADGARARADEVTASLTAGIRAADLAAATGDDRFLQVVDAQGRVLSASANVRGRPALVAAAPGRSIRLSHPLTEGGDFVVAVGRAGTPAGDLTVLAGSSLEDATDDTRVTAGLLAVGVPLLLIVVGATTWFVVGRTLAPVEAIRAEVDAISARELHRRLAHRGPDDEIGRLAATMNGMLARLEHSQKQQRRFISDASHELRSPVASIRQHAEVALSHPDRTTVPELADTVLAEDRRIGHLVEDLLLLARADENGAVADLHPVDLDDLVLDHASRVRTEGRVRVDLSGLGAGRVLGSRALLDRLVGNLVGNAAQHARSRIALSLTHDLSRHVVLLQVDDDGPGIPEADRERVFERFVRLDDARPRDTGGAGLGLAIADEVVRAHRGDIAVGESPLGGARLLVRLPVLDD